jgi:hypothetical protein
LQALGRARLVEHHVGERCGARGDRVLAVARQDDAEASAASVQDADTPA